MNDKKRRELIALAHNLVHEIDKMEYRVNEIDRKSGDPFFPGKHFVSERLWYAATPLRTFLASLEMQEMAPTSTQEKRQNSGEEAEAPELRSLRIRA